MIKVNWHFKIIRFKQKGIQMFHFIIPLIKGRLIGAVINRILPRLFPVVLGILKKQQSKKQNQSFSEKQKVTIDVQAREKK